MVTINTGHFDGGRNLSASQEYNNQGYLEELLAQAKADLIAVEARATILEAFIAGLKDPKDSCRLASAAALAACTAAGTGVGKTLTADANGALTVDGVAVAVSDRLLIKDQVAGKDNGIYTVTATGGASAPFILTRATDADTDAEVTAGLATTIDEGTANADTGWLLTTNNPITLDTTALTFTRTNPNTHAASHITGAADEIDGDQVDIDMTPSSYTPVTTPAEVTSVDHLSGHLAGIDNELAIIQAYMAIKQDRKDSCRLASAAALAACTAAGSGVGKTLTADANGALSVDGVAVANGDRLLIKNQVAGDDNGIYTVTDLGSAGTPFILTRATDADTDAEVTAGLATTIDEGTANADTGWLLTTNNPITLDTTALVFTQTNPNTHAASHITGAADEIDGDQVDIDMTPSNYTPVTTPAEVTSVDHLSGHLAGIDNELADVVQAEGSSAVAVMIQAGQPTTLDTITVGADVYEVDGVGANINFALGGSAAATLAALLAAAVANGTENLFWDSPTATTLRLRAADAPQGNIIGSDPSIVLDASSMTNYSFDCGDVNMNTLAGDAAAKKATAITSLTITTAMITAGEVRVSFPFTPTTFQVTAVNATGTLENAITDTFAITGDDILITLNGAGGDLANTDVVHIFASE
jgi:hypothetical protein